MPDVFSTAQRSFVMSRIRATGNERTEIRLIAILRGNRIAGWRRKQRVFGSPDFIFRKGKIAVFVDGCFWHCCPKHGRIPGANRKYWIPKLSRNKDRDRRVSEQLQTSGWKVIRIWQHDLADESKIVNRLRRALAGSSSKKPRAGPQRSSRLAFTQDVGMNRRTNRKI